jgi:hypothetical protein
MTDRAITPSRRRKASRPFRFSQPPFPVTFKRVMNRRSLHWFWRGAIALALGAVVPAWLMGLNAGPVTEIIVSIQNAIPRILSQIGSPQSVLWAARRLMIIMPTVLITLVGYGLLTHYFGPMRGDNETRCRKCGYILRGITEPRCPECGERI